MGGGEPVDGGDSVGWSDVSPGIPTCELDIAREQTRQALFGQLGIDDPPTLGRFVIQHRIGRGAMGVVYAAHDPQLDRTVALKVLTTQSEIDNYGFADDVPIEEARSLARVDHPNVVEVYDVGEVPRSAGRRLCYIAMELIDGATLREHVRRRRPDWREVLRLYREAGRGLAAVHRGGLVHRDFKPDNVMVDTGGRVRVMDFGLAHAGAAETLEHTTGGGGRAGRSAPRIAGSPAYMAPETLQGGRATPQSDQWSFCVSVYEALFGVLPFRASTQPDLIRTIASAEQPPTLPRSSLPRRVAAALRRGLSPTPSKRWAAMDELVTALEPSGHPRLAVLAAAGVVVAGVGLVSARAPERSTACDAPQSAFDAAWNPTRRSELAATLRAPTTAPGGTAARTVAAFSDYADRWTREYAEACGALRRASLTGARPEDVRMHCLVRAREQATALGDELFAMQGSHLGRAASAVQELPAPESCTGQSRAETPAPAPSPRHEALRRTLDRLWARLQLGVGHDLRTQAKAAIQTALALGDPRLVAEATLGYGRILMESSDREPAREELEKAFFFAEDAEAPLLAVEAALALATINATRDSAYEPAWHWWRTAETLVARAELDGQRDELEALRVEIMFREGRHGEATDAARALLARLESDCAAPCAQLPAAHGLLSFLYQASGRFEDALVHSERRIALWRDRYGDDHPETHKALAVKAEILAAANRNELAIEAIDAAEAGTIATYGEGSLRTANVQGVKATILLGLDRIDEALRLAQTIETNLAELDEPYAEAMALSRIAQVHAAAGQTEAGRRANLRAVELMEGLFPGGHPELSWLQNNVALDAYNAGDYEAALTGFSRALNNRRKVVKGFDPAQQTFLTNIGNSLRHLGRTEEAITAFEEGIALTRSEVLTGPIVTSYAMLWQLQHTTDPIAAARARETIEARCAALSPDLQKAVDCDYVNRVIAHAREG